MSEELAIQLHRLYRDYYARRLSFDDYRYRRALLLDSLAEGIQNFSSEDATLPRQPEFDGAETDVAEQPIAAKATRPLRFPWYYVLGISLVVLLAVIFVVTRQLEGPAQTPQEPVAGLPIDPVQAADSQGLAPPESQPEELEEPEVIRTPDVGQALVEEFVVRQDWREMSVLDFLDSWNRLPESDRIVAKGAVWFEPLSDALAYKIDEVREFAVDAADDEQLKLLYELAMQLGLVELVPVGWKPAPEDVNRGAESVGSVGPAPGDVVAADKPADAAVDLPATDDVPAAQVEQEAATISSGSDPVAAEPEAEARPNNPNACSAAQLQTRRRNCFDLLADGSNGPLLRVLPAGTFLMGGDARPEERPARDVTIASPFALSVFEVTAAEFRQFCEAAGAVCPENPWGDEDMPVVGVSWQQAVAYSEWLSTQTGFAYRLPTEEEWEYAARAGSTTDYPYGDRLLPAQARYSSITSYDSPLPISDRTTQRNEFELWHMVGNVREWVDADWTVTGDSGMKVVRGGSYASGEDGLRSAAREGLASDGKDRRTGIRLLREL